MKHAIIKFNNGYGCLLCNGCRTIIAYGFKHKDIEHYCDECIDKLEESPPLVPGMPGCI